MGCVSGTDPMILITKRRESFVKRNGDQNRILTMLGIEIDKVLTNPYLPSDVLIGYYAFVANPYFLQHLVTIGTVR